MQTYLKFESEQAESVTKKRCEPKRIAARPTQISSYYTEKDKGRISRRQGQVLEVIAEFGPMTNREVSAALDTFPSNITAALKNLENVGKLVVVGERTNPETRKNAMVYSLPDGSEW